MLSNLSELQTFTLFHREEFSKEYISNISEAYSIYKSGRLMWSLVGKNNPSKTLYLKYCQTKRDLLDLLRLVKKAIGK